VPEIASIGIASYGALEHVPFSTSNSFIFFHFSLELHKVWQWLCAVASPNMFVIYFSSCCSSVTATWTLFIVLFRVIVHVCETIMRQFLCSFVPPLTSDPGDATDHSCISERTLGILLLTGGRVQLSSISSSSGPQLHHRQVGSTSLSAIHCRHSPAIILRDVHVYSTWFRLRHVSNC